jgi:sirohydrochlorin ferrochelatase
MTSGESTIHPLRTGIVIVDHGSRRAESNLMLEQMVSLFAERFAGQFDIVEPAHMELAEPSIASAYAKCVARGARRVVVCPFFLGPGKHWTNDIPRLTGEAAARFPETEYHVTMTLGIDDLILDLLAKRVTACISQQYSCDQCKGTPREGKCAGAAGDSATKNNVATPASS